MSPPSSRGFRQGRRLNSLKLSETNARCRLQSRHYNLMMTSQAISGFALFVLSESRLNENAFGRGASRTARDRPGNAAFRNRLGGHCVQLVLGLDQRNIVFAFKKRKNRLNLQIVGDDFLADLQGEKGFIKGEGNTICQAYTTNSHNAFALCQGELTRHRRIGSHSFFTNDARRWFAANGVHVLHKTAQFRKFLRDLWRRDECAFAATNLDTTAVHKILDSPANGDAADPESRNKAVFSRELVADLQGSLSDLA